MRSHGPVPFLLTLSTISALPAQATPFLPPDRADEKPSLIAEPARTIRDACGGGGHAFHIDSSILKATRSIDVVLPASYAQSSPDRRYPVAILLDGEADLAPMAAVSEDLTRYGLIPETVIVAIENDDEFDGRVHDLTPPGLSVSGSGLNEGGDRFLDFIERELLPAIDRQFRGGLPRTLIGQSSGGILATYAAATRPTYRVVIAIDAPIHLGESWLAKKLTACASDAQTPLRYVYYGTRFSWPDAEWSALVGKAPASWKLHREQLRLEDHESVFMLGAYLGLREAFADYSKLAAPVSPTTRILPYYAGVSAALGAKVIPPKRLVRSVVDDLLMEGRGKEAHEAYLLLVSGYGAPSDGDKLLAEILDVESRPPPTETVESLLATPFPTPDEARAYLGEWIGDTWHTPNEPRLGRTILRITVVDGRVVGEIEEPRAPENVRVRRFDYLRVTPSGLTYGFMNGMRPRGVMLSEGVLHGDVLSGKGRWGGINFKYPEGMDPPEPGFSFKRVAK
jgi:hypothetical protein